MRPKRYENIKFGFHCTSFFYWLEVSCKINDYVTEGRGDKLVRKKEYKNVENGEERDRCVWGGGLSVQYRRG